MKTMRWYLTAFLGFNIIASSIIGVLLTGILISNHHTAILIVNLLSKEFLITYLVIVIIQLHWSLITWGGNNYLNYYKKFLIYSQIIILTILIKNDNILFSGYYFIITFMKFFIGTMINYYFVKWLVLKSERDMKNGVRFNMNPFNQIKKYVILIDEFLSWIVCSLANKAWEYIKKIYRSIKNLIIKKEMQDETKEVSDDKSVETKKVSDDKSVETKKVSDDKSVETKKVSDDKSVETKKVSNDKSDEVKISYPKDSRQYELSNNNVSRLKEMAQSIGLKNLSGLKKNQLINMIYEKEKEELER